MYVVKKRTSECGYAGRRQEGEMRHDNWYSVHTAGGNFIYVQYTHTHTHTVCSVRMRLIK